MASGPRTLNGKVVLKVYLLDNSMKTMLVEPTSTVNDVCRSMAEKIGFADPEDDSLCFSINECLDGITIGRALPGDKEVLGVMEAWYGKPDAKFIFQAKLYTDGMINTTDPKVIHMLFIQGIYHVISGQYPTADKDAITLAALQFQARFGAHNPATHKPGFLTSTLVEYLPAIHIEMGGKTAQQWEELIFHKQAFSTTTTPRETYLATLSRRDYYGAALFVVKQRFDRTLPKKHYIGISRRGILLLRMPASASDEEGMETLMSYPLADIYRWAYKPGVNFYFEIKGDKGDGENAVYTFDTVEGKHMSDLLTDYALALLREMGLNPDGSKRVKAKKAAASGGGGGGGGGSSAPPVAPTRAAMAASTDAYRGVAGDVGKLATAALMSGEYADPAPAPAVVAAPVAAAPAAAAAGAGVGGGRAAAVAAAAAAPAYAVPAYSAPPPPPPASLLPPPPPPPPPPAAVKGLPPLPPDWIECKDEGSGDVYYFNQVSGESVWERDEIPGIGK